MTYTLPSQLTVHDVAAIAAGAPIRVSQEARRQIGEFYHLANSIAETHTVYGRSTGVGANRHTTASSDSAAHGMNLLRSHAVDAGPAFDPAVTRAMLAVRLNQLLHPGSGVDVQLIDGLERMLATQSLPEVRRYGAIGTADLPALAGTALALTGERPTIGGGFEPIAAIGSDSALPFMSSNALTLAGAALAVSRLEALADAGLAAFALSATAVRANPEAFSPNAAVAIASPGAAGMAQRLATLLGASHWAPARIQDPFAFRGFLSAASVLATAVNRLREAVEAPISISQENPRFFADNDGAAAPGTAVHHGAFLVNWLAHELDGTALALAQLAPLTIARMRFMNDDAFTGLPRFLAPESDGTSGTMIIEYVAASGLGDIYAGAAPVSMHSATLSCGVEEDATFAPSALTKLERAIDGFEVIVAAEILIAVRAARVAGDESTRPAPAVDSGLAELFAMARALPSDLSDRDLRGDLETAVGLISRFAAVVGSERE